MEDKKIDEIICKVIKSITSVDLSTARRIIRCVEAEAERIGVKAVVAVADSGANIIAAECMDGAYIASFDIAINKAYTSVSLKMPTKALKNLAAPGGELYGIQHTNGGRIVIFGGGVPLIVNGNVVGGVGVSGGNAEEDTYLGDFALSVFEADK